MTPSLHRFTKTILRALKTGKRRAARKGLAGAAAIAAMVPAYTIGTPAHANTFSLGTISSSTSFELGNAGLTNWFADAYTFTVAAGSTVELSSSFSNVFGRRLPGIGNLWTTLYRYPGQFVESGIGSTNPYGDSGFFTEKTSTLDTGPLAPGLYGLYVQGHVDPNPGFGAPATADYSGNIEFAIATPIPEPSSWAMLGLGLAGVGFVARRRLNLTGRHVT
jgi:hypothetical protein